MASKRIQGITIEIGGDTTKLQSALKGVDKELSKTQGNLKDINKLLKLNPGNTELLVQKQKNLQDSIKATEDRLKTLKSTQKDALTPDEYDALQREIIETEQRLEGLKDEYRDFGSVAQQKIAAAAQAMQEMGGKISDAGRKMQEIGGVIPGELKKVGTAINEHVLQPMLQVAKVVGAAGIGVTTALTKGAVDAAAEYEQLVGGVETLFDTSSDKVIANAKKAYETAGLSANEYMNTVTSFSASLIQSTGRGAQTDLEALKRNLDDQYDEVKNYWLDRIRLTKDSNKKASLRKQQQKELKELKRHNKELVAQAEQANRSSVSTTKSLEKAARLADMAILDMSDNANKFGKDFASIEAAYKGFAKEQYQLLDNLSLGYAGSKEGVEQLLKDAEKLEGRKFDISSYSDIVEAIHAIQKEMKITGTTADEAAKTIEGSKNMMKAAWSNLLTAIGTGEDVKGATRNVLSTASTYLKENLLPTIKTSLSSITTVADEVWAWLEPQLPVIKTKVVNWLNKKIPEIPGDIAVALTKALYAIRIAISAAFAVMSAQLSYWITGDYSLAGKFRNSFLNAKEDIEDALSKIGGALSRLWNETLKPYLAGKLKTFITTTLPKLTDTLGDIADKVSGLIDWFNDLDPEIRNTIIDVGLAIVGGSLLISSMGKVIEKIGLVVKAISGVGGLLQAGSSIISLLTNPIVGIPAAIIAVGALAVVHWDDIKKLWNDGAQRIKEKVDWLKRVVPEAWKKLWDKMPQPVKDAVKSMRDWLSKLISKINTALSKLDKFLAKNQQTRDTDPSKARTEYNGGYYNDYGESVNIPSFFAKGGTLNEGQSAIVGEFAPEYLRVVNGHAIVTPMTNQPGRLGGDTTVNITINPQPGQSAEDIAAAVKRVFVREMQQREAAYA